MENIVNEPALQYNNISAEEYLKQESAATERHEYYRGEICAMSGASKEYNEIFSNFFGDIAHQLKGKGCKPYGSDFRYTFLKILCTRILTLSSFAEVLNLQMIK